MIRVWEQLNVVKKKVLTGISKLLLQMVMTTSYKGMKNNETNSLLLKRGIAFLVDLYIGALLGSLSNFNNIINNDKADEHKYLLLIIKLHHSSIAQSFITRILLFIYTLLDLFGSDSRKKTNGS